MGRNVTRAWPPQYPLMNSPASMPVKEAEIRVRIGIGHSVDPAGYRKYDERSYIFPGTMGRIKSKPIGNFVANLLDSMRFMRD